MINKINSAGRQTVRVAKLYSLARLAVLATHGWETLWSNVGTRSGVWSMARGTRKILVHVMDGYENSPNKPTFIA